MGTGWIIAAALAVISPTTEEVLVRGARLRELHAALILAEDRFYARYNALNKVDDFDIECAMDTHTGTKIPQRRCLTSFQSRLRALNGMEALEMYQQQASGPTGHPGTPPNTNPDAEWLGRYGEYKENMLYLLKMNPDLRRLVRARDDAEERYNTELKRMTRDKAAR